MAEKGVIMNIASQVNRLLDDHRTLARACRELTAERDALRAENRELQQTVREQKGELSRLRLSDGLSGGAADREQARARINRLLREVDRCIALLNKQEEKGDE
ncbi:MAG: hypothetical protein K2I43_04260 [Alistipes sp.]|nr:hypothetical protein [Alistipes sp.]